MEIEVNSLHKEVNSIHDEYDLPEGHKVIFDYIPSNIQWPYQILFKDIDEGNFIFTFNDQDEALTCFNSWRQ